MKKKKVKKQLKMTKFERFLYTLAVFLLLVSPISIVFSKATLAKVNFEVEQQKRQIEKQKKTNEGLSMTIDELASLTKIQEVAKQQGLSYNNNNIFLNPAHTRLITQELLVMNRIVKSKVYFHSFYC